MTSLISGVIYTKFVYDGFKLVVEFDVLNSDEVLRQYAWSRTDLDTPMWIKSNNNYYYYQLDGNKNVVGLIDEAGALANNYEYSPFGKLINEVESVEQPFKFSSEYFDSETNLVYYNYRYYNPENGKWLKRDPIEEQGGVNIYGFVYNNPVMYIDLLGLKLSDYPAVSCVDCHPGPNPFEGFDFFDMTSKFMKELKRRWNNIQLLQPLNSNEGKKILDALDYVTKTANEYIVDIERFLKKYNPLPNIMKYSQFVTIVRNYYETNRVTMRFSLDKKVFDQCLMKKSLLTVKEKLKLIAEKNNTLLFYKNNHPLMPFDGVNLRGTRIIVIFRKGFKNSKSQFRQLLAHEISHAVAGTKDYKFKDDKLEEILNDAYRYEQLF